MAQTSRMAVILGAILLAIVHVGYGNQLMRFDQVTCGSFQLENGVVTPAEPYGYQDGETVTVTCDSGYELIGSSQYTCYEDLGGWDQNKPQCVRRVVQCDFPDLPYGFMSRRSASGDVEEMEPVEVGAIIRPNNVIRFECIKSSRMEIQDVIHGQGHRHSVTCLSTGRWAGPLPTCKYVVCQSFELANGKVNPVQPHGYFDGDDVTVMCDVGYKLSGKSHLTCSATVEGWDDKLPTCDQVTCAPLDFVNGHMYLMSADNAISPISKTNTSLANKRVYFKCLPNLRMRSAGILQNYNYIHNVQCSLSGEWLGEVPTCENVTCGNFQLANGKLAPAQPQGYFSGEDVTMMCDAGYKLSGKSSLTCSDVHKGWNDELPTCEQVKCEVTDFTNGYMYQMSNNGQRSVVNKASIIPANSSVYFHCQPNMRMRTSGFLQAYNYTDNVLCRHNGEWGGERPTCESVACGNIEVQNGRITPAADAGYFNGEVVNVQCSNGFKLAGKAQLTCGAHGWINQPGECIDIEAPSCPKPPFENGTMIRTYQEGENMLMGAVKPTDLIHAGDVIEFRCNLRYMMKGEDGSLLHGHVYPARCQRDGTWNHSLPTCQLFECSAPPSSPKLRYTVVGQEAHYRCINDNYELLGPNTLTCRMDLQAWFPHPPTCRLKSCPTIRWPEDGMLVHNGRLQDASVRAECNSAFTLNGTAHRTCLVNGSWSGEPAVCISANSDCPNPGLPDGGIRTGNQFHYGARVTFSCGGDFILLGEATQHCLSTGQWSAPPVKCLGPDEYSDPRDAVQRWVDITYDIERDNTEVTAEHQVFFLMDSSGSIRISEINALRNFVGNLAIKLPNTKMTWVAFNTTALLLAEKQNSSGMVTALMHQSIFSAGGTNVRQAFRKVKEVLRPHQQINSTKVSIILLLNDHINEGGSLSNAMRMRWAKTVTPELYLVTLGGYINRRDLISAVSTYHPHSHNNAFFFKHKGDLLDLVRGIGDQ